MNDSCFWEIADRYSLAYLKFREVYFKIITILETHLQHPTKDAIDEHIGDVINLLHELNDLNNCVCFNHMLLKEVQK